MACASKPPMQALSEILTEISSLTGAHVDGFATDARVYGQYGPGSARDVLSQLLEGTWLQRNYDRRPWPGSPAGQLLLSTRTPSAAFNSWPILLRPRLQPTTMPMWMSSAQAQPLPSPMQPPIRAPFNPNALRNPQFPPDMQNSVSKACPRTAASAEPPNSRTSSSQLRAEFSDRVWHCAAMGRFTAAKLRQN